MKGEGWFNRIFLYYTQYEKGFYPEPGGANDQPAKFPELMITFGAILRDVEEEVNKLGKNKPKPNQQPKRPQRPQRPS